MPEKSSSGLVSCVLWFGTDRGTLPGKLVSVLLRRVAGFDPGIMGHGAKITDIFLSDGEYTVSASVGKYEYLIRRHWQFYQNLYKE